MKRKLKQWKKIYILFSIKKKERNAEKNSTVNENYWFLRAPHVLLVLSVCSFVLFHYFNLFAVVAAQRTPRYLLKYFCILMCALYFCFCFFFFWNTPIQHTLARINTHSTQLHTEIYIYIYIYVATHSYTLYYILPCILHYTKLLLLLLFFL